MYVCTAALDDNDDITDAAADAACEVNKHS